MIHAATMADGGDYADENARTDWLTLNHFVTLQDEDAAVMIANRDCLFFHLGEDVSAPMDSRSSTVHVLAGGQVDGKKLGIQNQGGDTSFTQRFSLTAGDSLSRTESMKKSMEFTNPVAVIPLATQSKQGGGTAEPAVSIESDDVIIWAIKPAEKIAGKEQAALKEEVQGRAGGLIVRLWNLADQPSEYSLSIIASFTKCMLTTHVETDVEEIRIVDGQVSGKLNAGAMQTFRFQA